MDEEWQTIVIDNRSRSCKKGFAYEDSTRSLLATVLVRRRCRSRMYGKCHEEDKHTCIGDEVKINRSMLNVRYPIERGVITNYNDMEPIWSHILHNELRVEPEDHTVLMTEGPLVPRYNRATMAQITLEKFKFQGFCVGLPPVLSLCSSGR